MIAAFSLPSCFASLAPLPRHLERHAQERGHSLTIGIDEAGVGTIAGPLVAAAVLLPMEATVAITADSKAMSRVARRDACAELIRTPNFQWACGVVSAHEVDALGDACAATEEAMQRAASRLETRLARASASFDSGSCFYIVDGEHLPRGLNGEAIVRADQTEACVAAASIVASVVHESCMRSLSRRWSLWDLDVNAGWPSRAHMHAVAAHGPTLCHRRSTFPFARRAGKRMAFHPDRHAYRAVQAEMRRAREGWPGAGADGCDGEESLDAAERARRERYRAFCAAASSEVADGDARPGPDSARTRPRRSRRARRSGGRV